MKCRIVVSMSGLPEQHAVTFSAGLAAKGFVLSAISILHLCREPTIR